MKVKYVNLSVFLILFFLLACNNHKEINLKTLMDDQLVGSAINRRQINGIDSIAQKIIESQFSTITPENILKWVNVHPQEGQYNLGPADKYVTLGELHKMFIVGHTLVWHSQIPDWVFQDSNGNPVSAGMLDQHMKDHIETVMGRYKGRIHGWDVVNEAVADNGELRKSNWYKIMGEDYIAKAFSYARQTDPDAELYYNDYNLCNPAKREGVIKLVSSLKMQGVRVDGIGMQGHWNLNSPPIEEIEKSILAYSEIVDKVMITELDIDVLPSARGHNGGADINQRFAQKAELNPYTEGLPDSIQQNLADRYAEIFELFRKHRDKVTRVTFWGVTDANSWKNNFPVRGRTNYPLLWDRQGNPKPAYDAVVEVLKNKN